jgi:formate transporter
MNSSDPKIPAFSFDAFIPPEMAERAEKIGVQKAAMGWRTMIALGVLAGGFISMGAVFSTTVTAGATGQFSYGVTRLLGGLVFSLGLILVVVAGAELFTGNNLIIMAWANGRVTIFQVLRNWPLVYVGNFAGAFSTAVLMYISSQYYFGKGLKESGQFLFHRMVLSKHKFFELN